MMATLEIHRADRGHCELHALHENAKHRRDAPSAFAFACLWMAAWLLGLLSVVAIVLLQRRIAGGLTAPLADSVLLGCGLSVAGVSVLIRWLQRWSARTNACCS